MVGIEKVDKSCQLLEGSEPDAHWAMVDFY